MDKENNSETNEPVVWKASPSQILNMWPYVITVLLIVAITLLAVTTNTPILAALTVLPLLYALWKFLSVRCRVYELTTERIRLYEGVLNQDINDVELYRVKDTKIVRPFWLRFFGLSTLTMESSDRSHPVVTFEAVPNGLGIREQVRKYVEIQRDKKRVREVDYEGEDDLEFE